MYLFIMPFLPPSLPFIHPCLVQIFNILFSAPLIYLIPLEMWETKSIFSVTVTCTILWSCLKQPTVSESSEITTKYSPWSSCERASLRGPWTDWKCRICKQRNVTLKWPICSDSNTFINTSFTNVCDNHHLSVGRTVLPLTLYSGLVLVFCRSYLHSC